MIIIFGAHDVRKYWGHSGCRISSKEGKSDIGKGIGIRREDVRGELRRKNEAVRGIGQKCHGLCGKDMGLEKEREVRESTGKVF